ncbi:hypothetical protein E3P81_00173 [Wallemia ichthyophaga]|nr:hypothetical protein E3P97_00175 [Wallemia ichthyophaga]TIB35871.1 hypothetical protein E3P85_00299 [Wallemia ichthyophaga]TIB50988.1 hypothetical protein E3P82_00175 [Wallemia ichthyophaga]TIB54440.1 hypothetical protein E3P81_00173 [Wallemia ichthyophaga]TIB56984.1 hypothetical protein E3P80_00175 [Wallemia ichthyophaga]
MDVFKRFQQRIHENIAESTSASKLITNRDFDFGSTVRIADAPNDKLSDIIPKLSSKEEHEIKHALKRVLVLLSHNRDLSSLFPSIVKLVSSRDLHIKILAYVYLTRYARLCPDLAMLSVNSFQKDSSHQSPLVRAQSIRVLSSISSEEVAPICMLCVKRAATDSNPYVRKAAALAIAKCYELDDSSYDEQKELSLKLMRCASSIPIGAAAYAFIKIHPDIDDLNENLSALHSLFRHLVRQLVDCEEWSQLIVLDLLARYSRVFLPRPLEEDSVDKDMKDLLMGCEYLLSSPNPAVAATASKTLLTLGSTTYRSKALKCLMRLRKESPEMSAYVMLTLQLISEKQPESVTPFFQSLFIVKSDTDYTKIIKLNILQNLMKVLDDSQLTMLAKELSNHTLDPDTKFAAEVIETIGSLSCASRRASEVAFKTLTDCSTATNKLLSQQSIIQLSNFVPDLLQGSWNLRRLLKRMFNGRVVDDDARATLVWVVSEVVQKPPQNELNELDGMSVWKYGPDVLRSCVKGFSEEGSKTQTQILNLAAKMMTILPDIRSVQAMARKVFIDSADLDHVKSMDIESLDGLNRRHSIMNTVAGLYGEVPEQGDQAPRVLLRRNQANAILTNMATDSSVMHKMTSSIKNNNMVRIQTDTYLNSLPEWSTEGLPGPEVREVKQSEANQADEALTMPVMSNEIAAYNAEVETILAQNANYEDDEPVDTTDKAADDDLERFLESDGNLTSDVDD